MGLIDDTQRSARRNPKRKTSERMSTSREPFGELATHFSVRTGHRKAIAWPDRALAPDGDPTPGRCNEKSPHSSLVACPKTDRWLDAGSRTRPVLGVPIAMECSVAHRSSAIPAAN